MVAIFTLFEDLDHSPKISDDFPNIIARRFYERIKMFPELFLRDSNVSEPCRRPRLYLTMHVDNAKKINVTLN